MAGDAGRIDPRDIALGLVAGGRATRLGGLDKAWLERGGVAQVLRLRTRFAAETGAVLASANRGFDRYAQAGLETVADRVADAGPLAALDALAQACRTPWLFTLPVDVVDVNDCVLRTLVSWRGQAGASAEDDDGPQPLVALWRVDALREAVGGALAAGNRSVHGLQATLGMPVVNFSGVRFGNLNTPEDLAAAGIVAR